MTTGVLSSLDDRYSSSATITWLVERLRNMLRASSVAIEKNNEEISLRSLKGAERW